MQSPWTKPCTWPCYQPFTKPYNRPDNQPFTKPCTRPCDQPFTKPCTRPCNQPFTKPCTSPCSQPFIKPCTRPCSEPFTKLCTCTCNQPFTKPCTQFKASSMRHMLHYCVTQINNEICCCTQNEKKNFESLWRHLGNRIILENKISIRYGHLAKMLRCISSVRRKLIVSSWNVGYCRLLKG